MTTGHGQLRSSPTSIGTTKKNGQITFLSLKKSPTLMIIGPLQWKGEFEPVQLAGVFWSLKKMTPGLWGIFSDPWGQYYTKKGQVFLPSIHLHLLGGEFQPFIFVGCPAIWGCWKTRGPEGCWRQRVGRQPRKHQHLRLRDVFGPFFFVDEWMSRWTGS